MPQATYDLADARRCLKQLREDLAAELPARAVSGEPGEGGEGIVTVRVPPSKVVVIEGRFALHPDIADAVDLRVHCGGSVHPLLLRQVARQVEEDERAQDEAEMRSPRAQVNRKYLKPNASLAALGRMNASSLPTAALYTTRCASCAELLVRNEFSPLAVGRHAETAAVGGHTVYGVSVQRGKTSADFARVATWIYGAVRTSAGRCISLDGPTHLLDFDWLTAPASTPTEILTSAPPLPKSRAKSPKEGKSRQSSRGQSRGASRGGVSVSGPVSAKAEERARLRSRARTDAKSRPWRNGASHSQGLFACGSASDPQTV